jgi:hypothetical protein
MVLFLGFEFSLTLVALAVVAFADKLDGVQPPSLGLWLLCILLVRALIGAVLPMLLAFARQLTVTALAVVAAVFIVGSLWFFDDIRADVLQVLASGQSTTGMVALASIAFAVLALGPLFLNNVSAIHEWDSLFSFNAVLDWIENRTSPYKMPFEYSSLWECRLAVPVLVQRVFGDAEGLIVVPQAEALLILAVATYVFAVTLIGDEIVGAVLALHAICAYHYWAAPVGLPNLKNDIIYNAGIVTAVLGLVLATNEKQETLAMLCICAGLSFVLVKYLAALLVPAMIAAFALADVARLGVSGAAAQWPLLVLPIVAAGVFSGHFYVKNLVRFGNPLYPVQIKLLGLQLAGYAKIDGTSIIEALKDRATRARTAAMLVGKHQFPTGRLWPIGLVALVASALVPLMALAGAVLLVVAPDTVPGSAVTIWAVATSAAAGIVSYLGTYGSASSWETAGDLFHLNRLHSARYALGVITVAIVAMVAAASLLSPLVSYGLAALVVADAGLRLVPAYAVCSVNIRQWRRYYQTCAAGLVVFCGLGLTLPYLAFLVGLVCVVAGIFWIPKVAAGNPVWWQRQLSGLLAEIAEAPATNVFLVTEIKTADQAERSLHSHLLVAGRRYQHSVRSGPMASLGRLEKSGWRPGLIICVRPLKPTEAFDAMTQQLVTDAGKAGFVPRATDKGFSVFEARAATAHNFDERPPLVDEPGDSKLIPDGASLLVRDGLIRIGLGIVDFGPPEERLFVKTLPSWLPLDETLLDDLRDTTGLSAAHSGNAISEGWQIYSDKGHAAEITRDTSGDTVLRITGTDGTKHLALIYWVRGEVGRHHPISIVAKVRSIGEAALNAHAFDFVPTKTEQVEQVQYVDRYGVTPGWSYLALSLMFEGSNSANRLAIGATLNHDGEGIEFAFAEVIDLPIYQSKTDRVVYKSLV